MNNAMFAGRIGRDAVLRSTGGDPVLGFSLAVDERKKGEKGTLWIDCSLWGKRAEALAPYLTAGASVCVAGQVGVRGYEGKNGFTAQMTLRVSELTLMGGKRDGQQAAEPAQSAPAAGDAEFDDEIPF